MQNHILVVDDDTDVRMLISDALMLLGVECETATNGKEALEKVRDKAPTAIFLDLRMPVMDGFSTLVHLQRDKAIRGIPVVVMSAMSDSNDILRAFPGVVGLLPKGNFRIDLLRSMLIKVGALEEPKDRQSGLLTA